MGTDEVVDEFSVAVDLLLEVHVLVGHLDEQLLCVVLLVYGLALVALEAVLEQ